MSNYAYLRVSSDSQDVTNQKHDIYEYCNKFGIADLQFVEDVVTGKKKWHERKLGSLVERMGESDKLIFAEVSRIARITATVLGFASEIEREFISMRTKEALAARKKWNDPGQTKRPI